MVLGTAIFLFFFGMAFWVLLFLGGFVGLWVQWGVIEITKAQLSKRGGEIHCIDTVSYTHLTLPTILLV